MEDTKKSEGIVLKKADYKENAEKITLFTQNGYLNLIVRGSKKWTTSTHSYANVLTKLQYVKTEGRVINTLTDAQIMDNYTIIKENPEKRGYSEMILEKLLVFERAITDYETLYTFTNQILSLLSQTNFPKSVALLFDVKLTYILGIPPHFSNCCRCGKETDTLFFSVSAGGMLCDACRSGITLSQEESKMLHYFYAIKMNKIDETFLSLSSEFVPKLDRVMEEYYETYFDFQSRVKKVYQVLYK